MARRIPSVRRVTAGILRRIRDGAERLRAALAREPAPDADPEPAEQVAPRSYGPLWNPPTVAAAVAQIFNTTDMASFEHGGRLDFAWLEPHVTPQSTVLDFGCGIGRVAYYAAPRCARLWAVDVSPRMLELAGQRMAGFGNVSYALCRDVAIPDVATATVDLAYALLVLQHLEREDAYLLLEELYRVVRPGGTVMLTFPNLLSQTYLDAFLRYASERASSQLDRARMYTPQEVECVMTAAGFATPDLDVATEIRVVARRP